MKFLVTGGAGFIGRHLIRHLAASGHFVRVVDDFSTASRAPFADPVEFIEGDVNAEGVMDALLEGVDGIFHLAAIPSVIASESDPLRSQRAGERALLAVLSAALRAPGVKRIVFASSAAVYGNPDVLPVSEDSPVRPTNNYGVSKLAGELYLRAACGNHASLDAVCLRLFNVYGKGQCPERSHAGVITRFLACCAGNSRPTFFGDGMQTRDFIWVEDVARACLLAMISDKRFGGRPINIASGNAASVREVWSLLAGAYGTDLQPECAPQRCAEIRDSIADVTLARELLNFQAETTLEYGLTALASVR